MKTLLLWIFLFFPEILPWPFEQFNDLELMEIYEITDDPNCLDFECECC